MKKILVPIDFSPNANKAIAYAARLAKRGNAELVLLHACRLPDHKYARHKLLILEYNRRLVKELFGKLDAARTSAKSWGVSRVEVVLVEGPVTESILKGMQDHNATLVVMGVIGQSGLRRKLLGSKVASLINRCPVPVLTVPHTYESQPLRKILLAVDKLRQGPQLLQPVFELAHHFDAEVQVAVFTSELAEREEAVILTQQSYQIEQELRRTYKRCPIGLQHATGLDFISSMQLLISQNDIDLIAMVTHRRGAFENYFNASLTQEMSWQSPVPLLSLHYERE